MSRYSGYSKSNNEREEKDGYTTDYESLALSHLALRKVIGYLGISLPIICMILSWIYSHRLLPSISHYYHSCGRVFFSTILLLLAIFLVTYKAEDKYERAVCKILAALATLIVILPTSNTICTIKECYEPKDLQAFVMPAVVGQPWEGVMHLIFAFLFFSLLIYLIFCKFIKHERSQLEPDSATIIIYKFCGWGMIVSMVGIAITMLIDGSDNWMLPPTFIFETTALFCFGTSWLARGESFRRLFD